VVRALSELVSDAVRALVFAAALGRGARPPPTSPTSRCATAASAQSFNQLFLKSPEMGYVYRDPSIAWRRASPGVTACGQDDAPGEHQWYDFNSNLVPDPRYRYLLGGSARGHQQLCRAARRGR